MISLNLAELRATAETAKIRQRIAIRREGILSLLDRIEAYEEALKSIANQESPGVWGEEMTQNAKQVLAKFKEKE